MMELQSRGPLTATPPLFTPATQARWIPVVGSPEFGSTSSQLVCLRPVGIFNPVMFS